jgi:DNA primase
MGRIIAFGGRVMPGSDDPAKYLNSPETALFSKGRSIFGIDLARQRIVETRTVAVVEGYTDVIMAHQFGLSNVVSVLGTAMTESHVSILRRFADRIVLLFDADTAGDAAVARVVQLFLTQPVEIAVASIPQGMDPDEFVLAQGAAGFERILAQATDALAYAWRQLSRQYGAAGDLTSRQKATQQYLELLAGARGAGPIDGLRWGAALARVSRLTDIPVDQLHRRFRSYKPAQRAPDATPATLPAPAEAPPAQPVSLGQEQAERWLLGALLAEPARWQDVQRQVSVEQFADTRRQRLARLYWDYQRDEGEPVFNELLSGLDEQLRPMAIELVDEVQAFEDLAARLDSAIQYFAQARRRTQEQSIAARLIGSKDQPMAQADETESLRKLAESVSKPDPGRMGPR